MEDFLHPQAKRIYFGVWESALLQTFSETLFLSRLKLGKKFGALNWQCAARPIQSISSHKI